MAAYDWIKMSAGLWEHPKVVKLASAIRPVSVQEITDKCPKFVQALSERCRVIGALFKTWAIADTHTEDGILEGYTAEDLDLAVGIPGWSLSLQHVGWLDVDPQRLTVPRFTEHNGESAKRRAEDAKRKHKERKASEKCPNSVRDLSEESRTRSDQNQSSDTTDKSVASRNGKRAGERVHFGAIAGLANDLITKSGYDGDDGGVFWKAAALAHLGHVSDVLLHEAAQGCRLSKPRNIPAYFRKSLLQAAVDLDGSDIKPLLASVTIVPACPKGVSWGEQ